MRCANVFLQVAVDRKLKVSLVELVLVEVDFPRAKKQSAELKKANQALQEKYKIEGYPTIIVLDSAGKKIGETGYVEGGPKAFIAELDKLKKQT